MKISVIVPVYKVERYLDQCVQSILSQSFSDFEIILVDDGSPDNCPAMCDAWAEKDSRIKVIHKENGGAQSAVNSGVAVAKSAYISFVDSDDWVEPDFLKILYEAATDYDADIAQCNFRRMYGDKELYTYNYPFAIYNKYYIENTLIPDLLNDRMYQISYSRRNKIYKSTLIKSAVKYTDASVSMGEDLLLNFACLMECEKIAVLDTIPLYNYRNNSESMSSAYKTDNKYEKKRFYQNMKDILLHYGYEDVLVVDEMHQNRIAYYIYECAISSMDYKSRKSEIKEILTMIDNKATLLKCSGMADTVAKRVCFKLAYYNQVDLMLIAVDFYKKIKGIK